MRNFFITLLALCAGSLFGQGKYRIDFITLIDKIPAVETCDAAADLVAGKSPASKQFLDVRATADSAQAELTRLQYAINTQMTPSAAPAMSAQDAKALVEKMKKMSKEEKIKWAMENAGKMMPQNTAHVSKDIDNKPVNDAVASVTKAQEQDMMYYATPTDCYQKFAAIEEKNRATLDAASKKFDAESGRGVTIIAEGTEQLWKAKYATAYKEYKKTVVSVYNGEVREKREYLKKLTEVLAAKCRTTEATVASTHYADDANENVNKSHLILAHVRVLNKVQEFIGAYDEIFRHYVDAYAALLELEPKE